MRETRKNECRGGSPPAGGVEGFLSRAIRPLRSHFCVLFVLIGAALSADPAWARDVEWIRQSGSPDYDGVWGAATGLDAGVYIVGETQGPLPGQTQEGALDAFVRRHGPDSDEIWTDQFDLDSGREMAEAHGVDEAPDGNVYVAGSLYPSTDRGWDAFVRKYERDGTEIYTQVIDTDQGDHGRAVGTSPDGTFVVAGQTNGAFPGFTFAGTSDVFLRKHDADGNELWTRQFGTAAGDDVRAVEMDSRGNVFLAGTLGCPSSSSNNCGDIFLRKYDPDGGEIWTRRLGTTFGRVGGLAVTEDGTAYVIGQVPDPLPGQVQIGQTDAFVRKYDPDGTEMWTRQFGTVEQEYMWGGVDVDRFGHVWISGSTKGAFPGRTNEGESDLFVRKYDCDGNELWTWQMGTPESDIARGLSLVDGGRAAYVSGSTFGALPGQTNAGYSDPFVLKLPGDCGLAPSAVARPARVCRGGDVELDASGTVLPACVSEIEYAWTETPDPPAPSAPCGPGQVLDCWDPANVTLALTDLAPPAGEDTVTYWLWVRPLGDEGCRNEEPFPVTVEVDSRVPDSELEVFVAKTRPEGLQVSWPAVPDGDSYRVASGQIGAWYSHATDEGVGRGVCDTSGNLSWEDSIGQSRPGSFYYLAVPLSACKLEGPWGAASDGSPRPERIPTAPCP